MTIKKLLAGVALVSAGAGAHAITVLSEGFNNIATLPAAGWVQTNNSTAPLGNSWFQGNSGIFPASSGAADSYIAANYLSTGNAAGAVSNWLFTPVLSLDVTSELSFTVRNAGDGFIDRLEVRLSTSGSSTNVGSTTTSVGDFSTLIGVYQASSASPWISLTYPLYSLTTPVNGRLAFRYVVGSVATAGNYLGVDDVLVTSAVPEPAAYMLMALGVAGLLLRRRVAA